VAGQSTCLSLHEFVAHPRSFDISLAYGAIGPGDDYQYDDWTVLDDNIPDETSSKTGFQQFLVDIPVNKTWDACTIQVRQRAADLDWYYYACADVRIVAANTSFMIPEDENAIPADQCLWEQASPQMRAKILTTTLIFSTVLVAALLVLVWAVWLSCRKQKNLNKMQTDEADEDGGIPSSKDQHGADGTEKPKDLYRVEDPESTHKKDDKEDEGNNKEVSITGKKEPKRNCCSTLWEAAKEPRAKCIGYWIMAFALVSGFAVGLTIGGLRACWF
jgi:hypothetical protein